MQYPKMLYATTSGSFVCFCDQVLKYFHEKSVKDHTLRIRPIKYYNQTSFNNPQVFALLQTKSSNCKKTTVSELQKHVDDLENFARKTKYQQLLGYNNPNVAGARSGYKEEYDDINPETVIEKIEEFLCRTDDGFSKGDYLATPLPYGLLGSNKYTVEYDPALGTIVKHG